MKTAVLAVVLTLLQTPAPIPRQAAANSPARSGQKVTKNAKTNQKPSKAPSALENRTATEPNQNSSHSPANANEKETVIVRELAPVSRKDWWDRAYVIFTGSLVLVGVAAALLARQTLRAIERQLQTMRDQVTEMQNAGKQTDRIIESMKDTAIRELRAYVCMSSAQIGFMRERAPEIHVRIKNYGKTPAYDVRMWIGGALGPYPLAHALEPPPTGFQMSTSTLAPDAKPYTMIFRHPEIPESAMPHLGTSMLTLYAYGEIVYRDAFGKQRSTKYRLMYGGRERAILKDVKGVAVALLKPDTEGNEAD